jgi:VCBS repeat-containing protein
VATLGDTVITGTHGTLTIDATGTFSYSVDNASASVQALRPGETLTDTFTYTAENPFGSEIANLTVSINGLNDAAIVGGDDAAEVTEDAGSPPFDLGILTVSDVDTSESSFAAGTYNGTYGSVQLTSTGSYTYTLNNSELAIQSLPARRYPDRYRHGSDRGWYDPRHLRGHHWCK